jgi:hypothetical protein
MKLVGEYVPRTSGHCGTFSVSLGLAFSISGCFVTDWSGKDESAFTFTPSVGLGGVEANWSMDEFYSNADDLSQLRGKAGQLDVNIGEAISAHGSVGTGGVENSRGGRVYTSQVGAGFGFNWFPPVVPGNVSGGVGYTYVFPIG